MIRCLKEYDIPEDIIHMDQSKLEELVDISNRATVDEASYFSTFRNSIFMEEDACSSEIRKFNIERTHLKFQSQKKRLLKMELTVSYWKIIISHHFSNFQIYVQFIFI